jgi:hypothetical protein
MRQHVLRKDAISILSFRFAKHIFYSPQYLPIHFEQVRTLPPPDMETISFFLCSDKNEKVVCVCGVLYQRISVFMHRGRNITVLCWVIVEASWFNVFNLKVVLIFRSVFLMDLFNFGMRSTEA